MLAWRSWRLDRRGVLRSPIASHVWTAGGNRASCQQENSKLIQAKLLTRNLPVGVACVDPPDALCYCGFYGSSSFQGAFRRYREDRTSNAVGLVALYGRAFILEDGSFRYQMADVVAVAVLYAVLQWKEEVVNQIVVAEAAETLEVPIALLSGQDEAYRWLMEQRHAWELSHIEPPAVDI